MPQIRIDEQAVTVAKGSNLMEAMVSTGHLLRSDCGGKGRCGKCRVRVDASVAGALSEPDDAERHSLGEAHLAAGYRLACRAVVLADAAVEIPDESRLAPEVVRKGPPTLVSRLELPAAPKPGRHAAGTGIAVDVGTTTIAVYLCDFGSRSVIASTSVRNPQAIFGDDVVSRISAVRTDPALLPRLKDMAVRAVDWAVSALCRRAGIKPRAVGFGVAVGNSTMIHLLLGEDPSSIGVFPYAPLFVEEKLLCAGDIGLRFNPAARLRTLPLISGYLGSDIVAAALAADLAGQPTGTLLIDVGTNGEIILAAAAGFVATSCATGPALEGAAIHHGMQATSGAIDRVRYNPATGCLDYTLIQNDPDRKKPPSGICGSGVIGAVAELRKAGVILESGSFNADCGSPCLRPGHNGVLEFEIVAASLSQTGRAITFTQADVRAVQLAKGALRTGIDLICRENGMGRPPRLLLAGAFGSTIDKTDALRIGMFPPIAAEHIDMVGNAAGAGAILSLLDEGYFERARELARKTRVFDLASHPEFQAAFIGSLSLKSE